MSGNLLNTNMMNSILGGGLAGGQVGLLGGGATSKSASGMIGGNIRSSDRFVLTKSFGNSWLSSNIRSPQFAVVNHTSKTTPFRVAMSAGDINGTINESSSPNLPGYNQVIAQRSNGTQNNVGGIKNNGNAYYTGNPKYVYDGADYTRFKRLSAVNKTYDDKSFGGANNGAYTYLMAVRRR